MLYPNSTTTASTAQAEPEHPLEARELDTFLRVWDPATKQFVVFDRATGWYARFPTTSRADAEMLMRFYEKQQAALLFQLR